MTDERKELEPFESKIDSIKATLSDHGINETRETCTSPARKISECCEKMKESKKKGDIEKCDDDWYGEFESTTSGIKFCPFCGKALALA